MQDITANNIQTLNTVSLKPGNNIIMKITDVRVNAKLAKYLFLIVTDGRKITSLVCP
jgi:hypothetical protein